MTVLRIQEGSGEAHYLQVARQLREQIIAGKLPVGEQLPSSRTVSERHGIGRITWGRALGQLQAEGLVMRRGGIGMFVASRPSLTTVDIGPDDTVTARAPAEEERERLSLGPLVPVLVVHRAGGGTETYDAAVTLLRVTAAG